MPEALSFLHASAARPSQKLTTFFWSCCRFLFCLDALLVPRRLFGSRLWWKCCWQPWKLLAAQHCPHSPLGQAFARLRLHTLHSSIPSVRPRVLFSLSETTLRVTKTSARYENWRTLRSVCCGEMRSNAYQYRSTKRREAPPTFWALATLSLSRWVKAKDQVSVDFKFLYAFSRTARGASSTQTAALTKRRQSLI